MVRVTIPSWQWNEQIQRGTDYASVERVREYDERMAAMRDVAAEAGKILDQIGVSSDDVVLEIGTGTGAFARAAARRCRRVIALDVSPVMLEYAVQRAREEGITTIDFREAGFLTYEHEGEPLAAAVSQLALHHLSDAWKLIALERLAGFLRPGGALYLTDVVFADEAQFDWPVYLPALVEAMPESSRVEMARHIRQEFSTFDWMMRALLERAGFAIETVERERGFLSHYLCRKTRYHR
jgi:putative AdoMet-dependent methyltransferase